MTKYLLPIFSIFLGSDSGFFDKPERIKDNKPVYGFFDDEPSHSTQHKSLRKSKNKYKIKYVWKTTKIPDVIVCKDSKVTIDQVKKAKQFWKKEGYNIGQIKIGTKYECSTEYNHGKITLTGIKDASNFYNNKVEASTTVWTNVYDDDDIVGVLVEVRKKFAYDDSLIIHEIGHALGFGHTNIDGHIMNEFKN